MTLLVILFALALAEHFYSLHLKDDICSSDNSRVNLITQLCGTAKDIFVPTMGVVGIIIALYGFVPHVFNLANSIFSFVICLVLIDFLYYLFHRSSHRFALPWMSTLFTTVGINLI